MTKKTSKLSPKPIPTKIVSSTPGRLRIRFPHGNRHPKGMKKLASALNENPNVNQVRTSIANGSITIEHDSDPSSMKDVFDTLKDLGVIFTDVTEGNTEAAAGVSSAVVDLNNRVQKATNGMVDLRILFPLGLASLSFRQLLTKGLQLDIIPWYVLAWYAFDSFIKLHNPNQVESIKDV